jgi:hypothetical protein
MRYESPSIESRQRIDAPLVLGNAVSGLITPSWTDAPPEGATGAGATGMSQIASPTWSDTTDGDTQDR